VQPAEDVAIRTVDLKRSFAKVPSKERHAQEGEQARVGRRIGLFRRRSAQDQVWALSGVSLEVYPGEVFGMLGPNGAGKTTLIKILSTLLLPTSGLAEVAGYDVVRDAAAVRRIINMVSGGEYSGYGILSVRENLWMFSQLYGLTYDEARRRIDRLLAVVDLTTEQHKKVNKLSTGMRQKMNFARGFINYPRILFLDEPTLGLDVTVSRRLRAFVREWVTEDPGRTVLLTTHYMQEADELCDRVAIIDRGQVLVCDRPSALKERFGAATLEDVFIGLVGRPLQNGGEKEGEAS